MLLDVFKALEGLKQSSNLHQGNHSATFTDWKYKGSSWSQSEAEPTIFAFIALGAYIIAIVLIDDVWFGIGTNEHIGLFEVKMSPVYKRFSVMKLRTN